MKLLVALAMLAGCSIHHRSDLFTCEVNTDCESGLICDRGVCITAASLDAPRPADAPRPGTDAPACPSQCTSCNVAQKTCTIDCQLGNCTSVVTCPAGYKCDIKCNADNSCRNGVNCQMAASCNIDCIGKQSCQNVQCGAGPCDVGCLGPSSCRGVSCNNSCACDVTCSGNQSCLGAAVTCASIACRSGLGCTSVPQFCHSCN